MAADLAVHIRERCEDCGGSGTQRVVSGAGHARWSKRIGCPTCDGSGQQERWIPLGELQGLLAAEPAPSSEQPG